MMSVGTKVRVEIGGQLLLGVIVSHHLFNTYSHYAVTQIRYGLSSTLDEKRWWFPPSPFSTARHQ